MTSKLVKCTCTHADQDKMYGQGNRMANETRSSQLRCTVCGTLHGSASMVTTTKKASSPAAEPAKKEPEKKVVFKAKTEKKDTKAKDTKAKPDKKADKKKSLKGSKR